MVPGYLHGIETANGVPIILPFTDDLAELDRAMSVCSGFLLTGGHDVSPSVYGEATGEKCGETCVTRDIMERHILQFSIDNNMPLLGICRGIQFINAALGGTLYQDLESEFKSGINHHQSPPYDIPAHKDTILPNTPLAELLGRSELEVNSYHHQAVKKLSPRLTEMAVSEDGLIEAVYMKEKKFIWGVQWHPEFSYKTDENSQKIFNELVSSAK